MKTKKEVMQIMESAIAYEPTRACTIEEHKMMLADLQELQRLEAEPRAGWEAVGEDQGDGMFYLVTCDDGGNKDWAAFEDGRWVRKSNARERLMWTPVRYLANIPPVPVSAKAPTANEWASAVGEWADCENERPKIMDAQAKILALLTRHNAASK